LVDAVEGGLDDAWVLTGLDLFFQIVALARIAFGQVVATLSSPPQTVAVVSAHAAAPLPIQRRLVAGFPARSAPWLPQTNGVVGRHP